MGQETSPSVNVSLEALQRAVLEQDAQGLKALLAVDAETRWQLLLSQGSQGQTAAHVAAVLGYAGVLEQLLQADHDMPVQRKHSYITSLSNSAAAAARAAGHQGLCQMLKEHGDASIDIMAVTANNSYPALLAAARRGNLPALQRLLARGVQDSRAAPTTSKALVGYAQWKDAPKSALEAAIKRDKWRQDNLSMVQQLAAAASKEQMAGEYGYFALDAAVNSRVEVMQVLLNAGAALRVGNLSILAEAVQSRSLEKAQAVIAALQRMNLDLDQLNFQFSTALQAAVKAENLVVVEALLQAGAPANSRHASGFPVLCTAAERGSLPLVELLLQYGADVNAQHTSSGTTALHVAARRGDTALVSRLLAAGADVSLTEARGAATGSTALEAAADRRHTAVISCLMAHTAQPPAAALVRAAWKAAGVATGSGDDGQSDLEDDDNPAQQSRASNRAAAEAKRQQHQKLVTSMLKAAAAQDCTATMAALSECVKDLTHLRRDLECRAQDPEMWDWFDVEPSTIRRPEVMLQAMAEAWLHPMCDLTAERTAVQHLMIAVAGSTRQLLQLQESARRVEELAEREKQVALREQQLQALEEQQQQQAQQPAPTLRRSKRRHH